MKFNTRKMGSMFPLAIAALLLAVPSPMSAADSKPGTQTAQELKIKVDDKETTIDYWLFLPKSYNQKKSWPLMLFLHGAGERGSNLNQVKKWGPPKRVSARKDFPFVVISPQCSKNKRWDPTQLHSLSSTLPLHIKSTDHECTALD